MRGFLIVSLCLAVASPAYAVTYRLTGSKIDTCYSHVYLEDGQTPDPTPCIGKTGGSFDGRIRLVRSEIDGPLRNRWLYLPPASDPDLFPTSETLTSDALRVRLGFPWEGDVWAGIHLNKRRQIDKWFFGSIAGDRQHEATNWGIYTAAPEFTVTGSAGRFSLVPWRPKARTALASAAPPVAPSPVPLPASAWLLMAGLLCLAGWRRMACAAPACNRG